MDYRNGLIDIEYSHSKVRTNLLSWYDFEPGIADAVGMVPVIYDYLEAKGIRFQEYTNELHYYFLLDGPDQTDILDGELLSRIKSRLSDTGKLFLALDNRLGMKQLSGMAELHEGTPFSGVNGSEEHALYTKKQITELLYASGFEKINFYYPGPDMIFPTQIFSDDFLPSRGDFHERHISFYDTDLSTFKESEALDLICDEGEFTKFANSYLIIAE